MKFFAALFFFIGLTAFSQTNGDFLGGQSYSKAKVIPIKAPSNIIEAGRAAEKRYLENRQALSDLEVIIIKLLKDTKINPEFKKQLEGHQLELNKIREENSYADSTLKIIEIYEKIEKGVALYYE